MNTNQSNTAITSNNTSFLNTTLKVLGFIFKTLFKLTKLLLRFSWKLLGVALLFMSRGSDDDLSARDRKEIRNIKNNIKYGNLNYSKGKARISRIKNR